MVIGASKTNNYLWYFFIAEDSLHIHKTQTFCIAQALIVSCSF